MTTWPLPRAWPAVGCLALFCVTAAAAPATAARGDTAGESPACVAAIEALRAREDQVIAEAERGRTTDARADLRRLQQAAARACLGGTGQPEPPPQSVLRPPVVVAPPAAAPLVTLPPVPAPPPPPPPPLPPVTRPAPATVTSCHATGCWSSDGRFLPRMGPGVVGPGGLCTVQPGGTLLCP